MKFSVNSKEFEKLLGKIYPVIPSRTPMPAIQNFLFEISDSRLTVKGTDMEMMLTSSIPILMEDGEENLSFLVPANLLYNVVRSFGDSTLTLETKENSQIEMISDKDGKYFIGYQPAESFPSSIEVTTEKGVQFSAKALRRALEKTLFATNKDSERSPAMMGVLFDFFDEGIRFVATDAHRLVRLIDRSKTFDILEQVIVPEKALSLLLKLLGESDVTFYINKSTVRFDFSDITFTTRVISNRYPDYNSVIPKENEYTISLNKKTILVPAHRVLLFFPSGSETTGQVRCLLSENNIHITAANMELGSSGNEYLPCVYSGPDMEIAFKPQYLHEVVAHLDDGEVTMKLNSPSKAVIFEPVQQKENEELLMLLMPIRLN